MEMKRKEELEVIIPSMARRLVKTLDHISNGNIYKDAIQQASKEIVTFQEYVKELNELKK